MVILEIKVKRTKKGQNCLVGIDLATRKKVSIVLSTRKSTKIHVPTETLWRKGGSYVMG